MVNLETTNLLLGILAAVSVLEALALIGAGIMGYRLYARAMETMEQVERRQVAPVAARVQEILADVKGVTARVRQETERVDDALRDTLDRVDETAERVKSRVRSRTGQAIGIVRGLRTVIEAFLSRAEPRRYSRTEAAGGRI